jgi:lipoprotein NlpI
MLSSRLLCLILVPLTVLLVAALARDEKADEYLKQAESALMKQDAAKALELTNKAISADAKNARAYLLRGVSHAELRKHTEAITDFDKCLELDPRRAGAYNLRGGEHFKLGHIKESLADFDKFLQLQPEAAPGHWQRGISLYYAGRFADGRQQFKDGEKVFPDDVENAVWHFLCNARLVGLDKAREGILKIGRDARVPMMEVYDLYKGKLKPAGVMDAAEAGKVPAAQRKERLFYAHLYLGLYYDATGDKKKALEHMALAEGKYRIGHYMGDVAHVHAEMLRKEMKK